MRIDRCTRFSLFHERFHCTGHELYAVSGELFKLHVLLAHALSTKKWDVIECIATEVLHIADYLRARRYRKFPQLHKTQHPAGPPVNKRLPVRSVAASD
jgi:hypothetical protein